MAPRTFVPSKPSMRTRTLLVGFKESAKSIVEPHPR
jgi:hypothetical protein